MVKPKFDPSKFVIRVLRPEDKDAVVEIDRLVTGVERKEYYERKCALACDTRLQLVASLVAEYEGKVIGFIMGNVYLGEFGLPEATAFIDTIGVHPDYQRMGIATELLKEFISHVKALRVERIQTLVEWKDWDLLQFFHSMGFTPAPVLNLELRVT